MSHQCMIEEKIATDERLASEIQRIYISHGITEATADDVLATWYEDSEWFAKDQASAFRDRCRDSGLDFAVAWECEAYLAWDDLAHHYYIASDGGEENDKFWVLLQYKACALRDWFQFMFDEGDD